MHERRHSHRRDDDIARDEIVEHAVEAAPLVTSLIRTWRVAVAVAGIASLIGGVGAAIGIKIVTPKDSSAATTARVDKNTIDIDSLKKGSAHLEEKLDILQRVACVNPQLTEHDKMLAHLDCASLLGQQHDATPR